MQLASLGELSIDVRKLEEYCLNPSHPRGRHKARVFLRALGLAQSDAQWLRTALLNTVSDADAVEVDNDRFGLRLQADVHLTRQGKSAVVRTLWIVEQGVAGVRFVTCWVI